VKEGGIGRLLWWQWIVKWWRLIDQAMDLQGNLLRNVKSMLFRVSIVNYNGQVLYDEYVKPEGRITNFRTWVSGVSPHHMTKAKPFS
jgi:hypothetical protein